jgi:nitrous oxide reductase accessory protein NosL
MFVAPFRPFLAEIVFSNGEVAFFDGPKDLFKHYLRLKKADDEEFEKIEGVLVTDYYSVEMIDGMKAYFVVGSDVYGPMGPELVPFRAEEDAKVFKKDHKGKSIHRFGDVDESTLRGFK